VSRLVAFAIALIVVHPEPVPAQVYPSRNLEIVVPFSPGAITDITARALAEGMSKALGQTVIVLNKDGGAGTIGTGLVAAAPTDGYMLGFSAMGTITGQPHLRNDLKYKVTSFDFVCQVTEAFSVILVSAESQYKSLKAMFDEARANPGKLTYGHPGPGSLPHLQMIDLSGTAGVTLTSVPFRGEAPARTALLGRHVDIMMSSDNVLPATIRPLAVLGPERLPALPDVPSTAELGFGESFATPFGLFAPKGLPPEALAKLRAACASTVKSESFGAVMKKSGRDIRYLDGPVFGERMAQHSEKIGLLARNIDLPKN
jgi:tripartite-type tricarboxylate transporter receptor subunit TctC